MGQNPGYCNGICTCLRAWSIKKNAYFHQTRTYVVFNMKLAHKNLERYLMHHESQTYHENSKSNDCTCHDSIAKLSVSRHLRVLLPDNPEVWSPLGFIRPRYIHHAPRAHRGVGRGDHDLLHIVRIEIILLLFSAVLSPIAVIITIIELTTCGSRIFRIRIYDFFHLYF